MPKVIIGYGIPKATCIRCKKPIGKGKHAIMEHEMMGGRMHFRYYHPHCHKAGYVWHHGRYVKESSLKKKKNRR